jgi:hypothetical protein
MNWIHSVRAIQRAQAKNQLVIFVGSGVSANSGLPTWKQMIRQIALKLPADFNSDAPFNPEVYLRIPEYLYEQDTSPDHVDYYRTITEILASDAPANPIDELIFEIRPHHIVTTNVDDLLERAQSLNTRLYAVVSQDADLLSVSSDRYLIKMHGDIKDPRTVVVKESDYLDYEQNHPLVSTFIRSLLINHTFLFIGYSLNDYNLNLILNWINFFRKQHQVKGRPQNFLVQTKTPSRYEVRRLASRNLSVVDLNTLPEVILGRAPIPPSLTAAFGRRLYAYLRCITDDRLFQHVLSLADTLDERLTPLLTYGRIAADDLLDAFDFGPSEVVYSTLILKDPEMFRRLRPVFADGRSVTPAAFAKAGIQTLACAGETPIALPDLPARSDEETTLLRDYLDNRYLDLQDDLETAAPAAQIDYGHLLGHDPAAAVAADAEALDPSDTIAWLLHTLRAHLAERRSAADLSRLFSAEWVRTQPGTGFLRQLFQSTATDQFAMMTDRDRLEDRLRAAHPEDDARVIRHIYGRLSARARGYWFFIRDNHLPFDASTNAQAYLKYAIQGMLALAGAPDLARPWDDVDVDIVTKFAKPRELTRWFTRYRPRGIPFADRGRAFAIFDNLCASVQAFRDPRWLDPLSNLVTLIAASPLSLGEAQRLREAGLPAVLSVLIRHPERASGVFPTVARLICGQPGKIPNKGRWLALLTQTDFEKRLGKFPEYAAVINTLKA